MNAEKHKCDSTLDYREIINRPDVDAVLMPTPDHWHAKNCTRAMDHARCVRGKPMCHTIEEAKQLSATVRETRRGAAGGIADHVRRSMAQSQEGNRRRDDRTHADEPGSYHRNSVEGEWNYKIDAEAGRREWRQLHRLENMARSGAEEGMGCGPLFPLPEVLGLFGRNRDRPVLSCGGAAEHLLA